MIELGRGSEILSLLGSERSCQFPNCCVPSSLVSIALQRRPRSSCYPKRTYTAVLPLCNLILSRLRPVDAVDWSLATIQRSLLCSSGDMARLAFWASTFGAEHLFSRCQVIIVRLNVPRVTIVAQLGRWAANIVIGGCASRAWRDHSMSANTKCIGMLRKSSRQIHADHRQSLPLTPKSPASRKSQAGHVVAYCYRRK